MSEFTPTQSRLMSILSDGLPHARRELRRCIDDGDMGHPSNLCYHVRKIRLALLERGEYVVCELHRGTISYRHVRLLALAGA